MKARVHPASPKIRGRLGDGAFRQRHSQSYGDADRLAQGYAGDLRQADDDNVVCGVNHFETSRYLHGQACAAKQGNVVLGGFDALR